jgi:hypothetical protein
VYLVRVVEIRAGLPVQFSHSSLSLTRPIACSVCYLHLQTPDYYSRRRTYQPNPPRKHTMDIPGGPSGPGVPQMMGLQQSQRPDDHDPPSPPDKSGNKSSSVKPLNRVPRMLSNSLYAHTILTAILRSMCTRSVFSPPSTSPS